MTFSFDPDEFAPLEDDSSYEKIYDEPDTQPMGVADVAQSVLEELDNVPDEDDFGIEDLTEVTKRLDVASYYRTLLDSRIFNDPSQAALIVESRIRKFVRSELDILLGIKPQQVAAPPQSTFSSEEVEALKAIASRLLGGGRGNLGPPQQPRGPVVNRVDPPKSRRTPTLAGPSSQPKANLPRRKEKATPKKKPQPKKPQQPNPARDPNKAYRTNETNNKGEQIIRKGHKKYVERVADNGKKYLADITPQLTSPARIPMPSKAAFESAMQAEAQNQIAFLSKQPIQTQLAVQLVQQ